MPIEQGEKPEQLISGANGQTQPSDPPKSLREIAEQSWDEVIEGDDFDNSDQATETVDDGGVRRDKMGRFASQDGEPGEAEAEKPPSPADEKPLAPDAATPADPALGSNQPPQHWSEQDRAMFDKLPQEGQSFLLRRHTEMERDYTAKAQKSATAVQFTDAVGQLFADPVIDQTVRQTGLSPYDMIHALLGMQRRGMSPDPREKMALLTDVARNIGLDPAAIFTSQPAQTGAIPGLSEADQKDPAIKFFADHIGQTAREVQGLRNALETMQRQGHESAQAEALKVTRWGIDGFAEEKDAQGNPAHPYFDRVLPHIIELFRANPGRDLRDAYNTALWMDPEIRAQLQQRDTQRVSQGEANRRAAQAARSNLRGRTSPVGRPNGQDGGEGRPRTLRETIEASADEIGF